LRKIYDPILYYGKVEEFIVDVKKMDQDYGSFSQSPPGPNSSVITETKSDFMEEEDDFQNYLYDTLGRGEVEVLMKVRQRQVTWTNTWKNHH